MNDLELKERILKNPITTILGITGAVAAVYLGGGDKYAIAAGIVSAVVGALMKHPQIPSGGSPA